MKTPPLSAEQRKRAVALVVNLTANTHLAPMRYERRLLERYEGGELTINQIAELMSETTYQVLYHSQATSPMLEDELQDLLTWSRDYNARHGITGLLLYSDGRFVQLLEGREVAVKSLFARIQQDTRNVQVMQILAGPGPQLYPDWSMAFGYVTGPELEQTLLTLQVQSPLPPPVADPNLRKLLQLFS